jgi:alkylation response protein AidB-like acyl-CoA dehydrogenase
MADIPAHDPVKAAAALAPKIREARDELDSARRLPKPLVDELDKAGLLRLGLPRSMGGHETNPLVTFQAIEELSRADGSVGWCAMLSSGTAVFAGWLKPDVARSMFGQPPDFRLAGSIRPEGRAISVDGGYRVSGLWDYASGVDHASWLLCTCYIEDSNGPRLTAEGTPVTRVLLAPAQAATIIDTWDVMGMRGTGSNDFVLDDVFVPDEHTFSLLDPPLEKGSLYHPRFFFVGLWTQTVANSLGMARGAMDAYLELASQAGSTMSRTLLRDRPSAQSAVGEAEAIISGARAYVLDAVGRAWQAVCNGCEDPSWEIAQARLAITHGMRESVRAVDILFHAAGTNAIHRKHPLERFFRDIHVAAQHVAGLPSNIGAGGRVMLGLPPGGLGW